MPFFLFLFGRVELTMLYFILFKTTSCIWTDIHFSPFYFVS
jgi:hypothetical protein